MIVVGEVCVIGYPVRFHFIVVSDFTNSIKVVRMKCDQHRILKNTLENAVCELKVAFYFFSHFSNVLKVLY